MFLLGRYLALTSCKVGVRAYAAVRTTSPVNPLFESRSPAFLKPTSSELSRKMTPETGLTTARSRTTSGGKTFPSKGSSSVVSGHGSAHGRETEQS